MLHGVARGGHLRPAAAHRGPHGSATSFKGGHPGGGISDGGGRARLGRQDDANCRGGTATLRSCVRAFYKAASMRGPSGSCPHPGAVPAQARGAAPATPPPPLFPKTKSQAESGPPSSTHQSDHTEPEPQRKSESGSCPQTAWAAGHWPCRGRQRDGGGNISVAGRRDKRRKSAACYAATPRLCPVTSAFPPP